MNYPDPQLIENGFDPQSKTLTFTFANEEAATHFKSWLCNHAEQDYWEWMKRQEERIKGRPITGLKFNYWTKEVVEVQCGRLEDDL